MPGISRRQMVGGLLSWQLVARPRPAAADQARFRLLEKRFGSGRIVFQRLTILKLSRARMG